MKADYQPATAPHCYDAGAARFPVLKPGPPELPPRLLPPAGAEIRALNFALPSAADFAEIELPWLFVRFQFTLATPYSSKDDTDAEQSPIVRDWVYLFPMVRPTSWKGALRAAAVETGADAGLISHLFGNERTTDDEVSAVDLNQGRLRFFPTFFPHAGEPKQIFNPHSRKTRKGATLANFGIVPPDTKGSFALLYAPLPHDDDHDRSALVQKLSSWIAAMMTQFGVGSKTLKGNGLCKAEISQVTCWPNNANDLKLADTDYWNLGRCWAAALPAPPGRPRANQG